MSYAPVPPPQPKTETLHSHDQWVLQRTEAQTGDVSEDGRCVRGRATHWTILSASIAITIKWSAEDVAGFLAPRLKPSGLATISEDITYKVPSTTLTMILKGFDLVLDDNGTKVTLSGAREIGTSLITSIMDEVEWHQRGTTHAILLTREVYQKFLKDHLILSMDEEILGSKVVKGKIYRVWSMEFRRTDPPPASIRLKCTEIDAGKASFQPCRE